MRGAKELTKELYRYIGMFDMYWDITNTRLLGSWWYTHPTHPRTMYWCLCTYTAVENKYLSHTDISKVIPGTPSYKFQPNIRVYIELPFMAMYLY